MRLTKKIVGDWLDAEERRLKQRQLESRYDDERSSLGGSLMTVRKMRKELVA